MRGLYGDSKRYAAGVPSAVPSMKPEEQDTRPPASAPQDGTRTVVRKWQGEDVRLRYRVVTGTSATLLPIMVVRGLGMTLRDSEAWSALMASETGRSVVTMDNRGSGGSSMPVSPYTFDDMAGDVAVVLEHYLPTVQHRRCHLIGVSMGGVIAMKAALQHRRLVASLTVGCSYARPLAEIGIPPEYIDLVTKPVPAEVGERREHFRKIFEYSFTPSWIEEKPARFAALLDSFVESEELRLNEGTGGKGQEHALLQFAEQGMVKELSGLAATPTLVMAGDSDRLTPHWNSIHLHSEVSGSHLSVVPYAGHLFWEMDTTVQGVLTKFFSENDSSRQHLVSKL